MTAAPTRLSHVSAPRRQVLPLAGALIALCALAWTYLWRMERDMPGMAQALYRMPWSPAFAVMICGMWVIMMAAMMIPSALPMFMLMARLQRPRERVLLPHSALFASGYLLIWSAFGGLLTGLQWLLNRLALSQGADLGPASWFGAGVLLLAGLYQWSPWKEACLKHCQTPLGFLLSHWRDGGSGALRMGLAHGVFCLGCCWLLMSVMLVGGAMNLAWMCGITVYLLLERTLPPRLHLQRISGSLLLVGGLLLPFFGG